MELIYLYIDKYRNFQAAEFNFSQDVRIHFDNDSKKLTARPCDPALPDGFWGGNIKNLTTLIVKILQPLSGITDQEKPVYFSLSSFSWRRCGVISTRLRSREMGSLCLRKMKPYTGMQIIHSGKMCRSGPSLIRTEQAA